jgi:hypothetical protein
VPLKPCPSNSSPGCMKCDLHRTKAKQHDRSRPIYNTPEPALYKRWNAIFDLCANMQGLWLHLPLLSTTDPPPIGQAQAILFSSHPRIKHKVSSRRYFSRASGFSWRKVRIALQNAASLDLCTSYRRLCGHSGCCSCPSGNLDILAETAAN